MSALDTFNTAKEVLSNMPLLDATKRGNFLNAVGGGSSVIDWYRPIESIVGIAPKDAAFQYKYGSKNQTTTAYYLTSNKNTDKVFYSAVLYLIEYTQKTILAANPPQTIIIQAQTLINEVTGSDNIMLTEKLTLYKKLLNLVPILNPTEIDLRKVGHRYDGQSDWSYYLNGMSNRLPWTYIVAVERLDLVIEDLKCLAAQAQYIAIAQMQKIEEDKRKADGYYAVAIDLKNTLINPEKADYGNMINSLRAKSSQAQIGGFPDLIDLIKEAIVRQKKAASVAQMEGWMVEGQDYKTTILPLINALEYKPYYDWLIGRYNTIVTYPINSTTIGYFKDLQYDSNNRLLRESNDSLMTGINKVLGLLPEAVGIELYNNLLSIVENTDREINDSLRNAISKLTTLLPKVDAVLVQFHADEILEIIKIEEEARLAELDEIKRLQSLEKEQRIIELKSEANLLLPQLNPEQQAEFQTKMDNSKGLELQEKLAFYGALVPILKELLAINIEFEFATAEEITGIDTKVEGTLDLFTDWVETEIILADLNEIPAPSVIDKIEPKRTIAGGGFPLLLGAGFLFNYLGA